MFNMLRKNMTSHLALTVALLASPIQAETTLNSIDGTVTITGELLSFDDTVYRILAPTGELLVRREFVTCSGDGCPELETEGETSSKEVVLKSNDGRIELTGVLVSTSNTEYVIETLSGRLTVRREFTSCEGDACPEISVESDQFTVTISGADSADLVASIVDDYTLSKDFNLTRRFDDGEAFPTLLVGNKKGLEISRISLRKEDASGILNTLVDGESQFAITRDRVTAAELSSKLGKTVDDVADYLNEEIIGLDAISFVVSKSNGIDVIGTDSARAIMDGEITNWSQLGGANQPITIHAMDNNEDFMELLQARGITSASSLSDATLHASADDLNAALDNDPTGFGVIYRSQADGVKALNIALSCNIFVDNSDFAIQTEEHPLALRWYQYSMKDGISSEFARNVGQFIPTDFGQQSIASRGLVTQQLQIVPMQDQGARLLSTVLTGKSDRVSSNVTRNYFEQASNARRISTSLRFQTGNATLDSKASSDIDRISEIIRSNEYDGYEILIFGFSDSYGNLNTNLSLSKRRADAVRNLLLQKNPGYLDNVSVQSFGIGPIAPVGCNDVVEGREQNRRVEIWVRPRA